MHDLQRDAEEGGLVRCGLGVFFVVPVVFFRLVFGLGQWFGLGFGFGLGLGF